jgi:hypothetical protein
VNPVRTLIPSDAVDFAASHRYANGPPQCYAVSRWLASIHEERPSLVSVVNSAPVAVWSDGRVSVRSESLTGSARPSLLGQAALLGCFDGCLQLPDERFA